MGIALGTSNVAKTALDNGLIDVEFNVLIRGDEHGLKFHEGCFGVLISGCWQHIALDCRDKILHVKRIRDVIAIVVVVVVGHGLRQSRGCVRYKHDNAVIDTAAMIKKR